MEIIIDVLIWLLIVFIAAFSVRIAYRAVRARGIAGRAGLVKTDVNWTVLILWLVACGALIFFGIGRLNDAEKYFDKARMYEALLEGYDKVSGDKYQQAAIKPVSAESIEKIRSTAEEYRETGSALRVYAIGLFVSAFAALVSVGTAFWYVTEEGIMFTGFKTPEPFYAALNGNRIEIHYTAQLKNANKVMSFGATPKNLALFGRFMVQESPQNPQDTKENL